jgi:hypothetical protein
VNIALPGYRVVPVEQLDAERVADATVVVEAPVETLDVLGRHEVEEVLVEIGAHELPAARRESAVGRWRSACASGPGELVERDRGVRR